MITYINYKEVKHIVLTRFYKRHFILNNLRTALTDSYNPQVFDCYFILEDIFYNSYFFQYQYFQ